MIVAVLGVGAMGAAIAANLERAGHEVRRWDPEPARATVATAADAARGADVVLTMTPDAAAADAAVTAAAPAPGTLWLQCATVGTEIDRLAARARELGLLLADAPVLGTTTHAEAAQLHVLAAGPAEARPLCESLLAAIARRVDWVGEVGAASRLKLVFNAWLHTLVANVAECVALAQALGVDPERFLDVVADSPADTPMLRIAAGDMLRGSFVPGLTVEHARKDALLIADAARDAGVAPHLTEAALELLDEARRLGHGDKAFAAMVLATRS